MDKLKPCPFCGGKAYVRTHIYYGGFSHTYCVQCHICGAQGSQFYDTEKDAIEAWNRRIKR